MKIGKGVAAATIAACVLALGGTSVASAAPGQGRGDGPLKPLVAAGTISADQARTVQEALHDACQQSKTDALATLVQEGVITQAQADAIAAAPRNLRALVTRPMRSRPSSGSTAIRRLARLQYSLHWCRTAPSRPSRPMPLPRHWRSGRRSRRPHRRSEGGGLDEAAALQFSRGQGSGSDDPRRRR